MELGGRWGSGMLSTSSLTTGQVRGWRSGTEHADLVGHNWSFVSRPTCGCSSRKTAASPRVPPGDFNGAHAGNFFFCSARGLHRENQLTVANGSRGIFPLMDLILLHTF